MKAQHAETYWRATAAIALAVGVTAAFAPRVLARGYGLPQAEMTGSAQFGWRLFGVRTAIIGAAAFTGSHQARRVIVPVQILDQTIFAAALLPGSIPRRTAILAISTSATIIAGALLADRAAN